MDSLVQRERLETMVLRETLDPLELLDLLVPLDLRFVRILTTEPTPWCATLLPLTEQHTLLF